VLPLLALLLGVAVIRGLAARRRDRSATQARRRVIELCDGLRAELAGGDVVSALRGLAVTPGAEALRVVAGAWHVAHRTGHGLADTLGRVAADLRAAERTRRVVGGELASARATARLLAALPGLALLMGSGAGARPLHFLLAHPAGLICLAGGLAAGYVGLAWIEALARDVDRHG